MGQNEDAFADDQDSDRSGDDTPKRRRKPRALAEAVSGAPADALPVLRGDRAPPRLMIAEAPLGDADDDEDAPRPVRARRRPRVEHVSQPPRPADPEDETSDDETEATARPARPRKKTKPKAKAAAPAKDRYAHLPLEITGVVVFAVAVLTALSLLSYDAADAAARAGGGAHVKNLIGPGGAVLAEGLTLLFGVAALGVPAGFLLIAIACFKPVVQPRHAALRLAGGVVALLGAMVVLHLLLKGSMLLPFPAGGLVGAVVADAGSRAVYPVGTGIIALAGLFIGSLLAVDRPLGPTARSLGQRVVELFESARERAQIWREERRLLAEESERLRAELLPEDLAEPTDPPELVAEQKQARREAQQLRVAEQAKQRALRKLEEQARPDPKLVRIAPAPAAEQGATDDDAAHGRAVAENGPPTVVSSAPPEHAIASDPPWAQGHAAVEDAPGPADEPVVDGRVLSLTAVLRDKRAAVVIAEPDARSADAAPAAEAIDPNAPLRIVERAAVDATAVARAAAPVVAEPARDFALPPLNLLDYDVPDVVPIDEARMRAQADKLIAKFRDFGIEGRVVEVRPGPVVTTYEFVPAPGIRVSKIAALADDIAMAMEAIHVRIVAPIPGKGAVGIEIPNDKRETVFMKEIIADPAFKRRDDKLLMALGKDIEGKAYYANLADMPHVLIAGTTGSGKSVSVNAMICSILYRSTPADVRFLMIDPKMLELSIYEGIPHLLLPPIIDSKKAALALKWAVSEMERRYQLMSELGVRDIAGFNKRIADAQDGKDPELRARLLLLLEGRPIEKLPFIVIVVDEYADLLAVAGKDVELYIMRLAQKARAAGLHVMLATQRPSVDVITGVIKANFPVRMGFRLASNHDSKTIINQPGAEKLLGRGDMLFMPPGTSNVVRVHGAFISEKELHRVVDFLKSNATPTYDMSILTPPDDEAGEGGGEALDEPKDARYDEAVAVVARTRKCSTSWLQRMMNLGYQRAARIVDRMEREGMVGPAQNAKGDREIYVKPEHLAPGDPDDAT